MPGYRSERFKVSVDRLRNVLSVQSLHTNYNKEWRLHENVDISNIQMQHTSPSGIKIIVPTIPILKESEGQENKYPRHQQNFQQERVKDAFSWQTSSKTAMPKNDEHHQQHHETTVVVVEPDAVKGWTNPDGELLEDYSNHGLHIVDESFQEDYLKSEQAVSGFMDNRGNFQKY